MTVLLPYLGKPFTIDDVTFLLQAQHVLSDPWHPTAFDMVFDGTRIRLSKELVSGPVMAFLLVPTVRFGNAEWIAHLTQLGVLAMGVGWTALLALQLGLSSRQAGISTLLVVASPPVLGMAATAMPDVAAMTFTTAAIERWLAYVKSGRLRSALVAGIFMSLAILSRPHVVLAVVVVAPLLALRQGALADTLPSGSAARRLLPLILGMSLTIAAILLTRDPESGTSIAAATVHRVHSADIWFNLSSFVFYWASAFPLAIVWPTLRGRPFFRLRLLPLSFNAGMLLILFGVSDGKHWHLAVTPETFALLLLAGLASATLIDIIVDGWARRDHLQLILAGWLLIAAAASTYVQLPPKLLIPSVPAMAILLARRVDHGFRLISWPISAVVALGIVLGLLIIRADRDLAEIGRQGGRMAMQMAQGHRTVWADGAWGFQWYAMAAGAHAMADSPPLPRAGDVVVTGLQSRLVAHSCPDRTLLYRRAFARPGGRVLGEGAGFFTNRAGPWLWTWGQSEIGRLEVWRVGPRACAAL